MNYLVIASDYEFIPSTLTIKLNDSVTWENKDSMKHSATRSSSPTFDTGLILPNSSSSPVTFQEKSPPEGFEYFCRPHPFMKARIIVDEP